MRDFFDNIADIYDETRCLPVKIMENIVDVMVKELKGRRVLEIGVGTGRFAGPLEEKGIDLVGVDFSKMMLQKARGKGLKNLVYGDVCQLPFKDQSIDSVISVHVLHLIDDCDDVLREIKRVSTDTFVSVLYKRSGFQIMEEYRDALSNYGYTLMTKGLGENKLRDVAVQRSRITIPSYKDMLTLGERLNLISERKHSYALDTPNEIHSEAVVYLRNKWKDKLDFRATSQLEVLVWEIHSLPSSIR